MKNNREKGVIICPEHGEFLQNAKNHQNGHSCPKCNTRKISNEEKIEMFRTVHGKRYDYSRFKTTKKDERGIIICSEHGEFLQSLTKHRKGFGCPKCSDCLETIKTLQKNNTTKNETLEMFEKVHGFRYDYSSFKTQYSSEKSIITCPEHGEFLQSAQQHIKGRGCKKCGTDAKRIGSEQYLEKFVEVHNDKYDYSKFSSNKSSELGIIICPKHGEFVQNSIEHNRGVGCPKCRRSKGEEQIEKYLVRKKIDFVAQKMFEGCVYKNRLSFDFHLPKMNTCIEFQGEQHYKPIAFFGGVEKFEIQQKTDQIKKKYCVENRIKLLEVKYTVKDVPNFLETSL